MSLQHLVPQNKSTLLPYNSPLLPYLCRLEMRYVSSLLSTTQSNNESNSFKVNDCFLSLKITLTRTEIMSAITLDGSANDAPIKKKTLVLSLNQTLITIDTEIPEYPHIGVLVRDIISSIWK